MGGRTLGICLLLFAPLLFLRADEAKTVEELAALIRKELPPGWEVAFDPKCIQVERIPFDKQPKDLTFVEGFRVMPFLSPEGHRLKKLENEATQRKIDRLKYLLQERGIARRFYGYQAKTPEDRKLVEEYENLESSLHQLPNYWFHDISLQNLFPWSGRMENQIEDPVVRKECQAVMQRVRSLLTPYPKN